MRSLGEDLGGSRPGSEPAPSAAGSHDASGSVRSVVGGNEAANKECPRFLWKVKGANTKALLKESSASSGPP